MHESTGRWKLGLTLSAVTALMWGLLPIAIKDLLVVMDPWTITFYRFSGAALLMGLILWRRRQLPRLRQRHPRFWALLAIAIVGLSGNYILFLWGLEWTTPATTQVVIQLAPMLLMFGGLWLFKESFSRIQWLGFATFLLGLVLFFNEKLWVLFDAQGTYGVGLIAIIGAAVTWAAFALAQKQLLQHLHSMGIMFVVLLAGSLLFAATADPSQVIKLDQLGLAMLIFSSLNTAIAYSAFAEALNHWPASRASAVLSLTPVITVLCLELLAHWFPERFQQEPLNTLTVTGIVVVVAGSALTALGRKRGKRLLNNCDAQNVENL